MWNGLKDSLGSQLTHYEIISHYENVCVLKKLVTQIIPHNRSRWTQKKPKNFDGSAAPRSIIYSLTDVCWMNKSCIIRLRMEYYYYYYYYLNHMHFKFKIRQPISCNIYVFYFIFYKYCNNKLSIHLKWIWIAFVILIYLIIYVAIYESI